VAVYLDDILPGIGAGRFHVRHQHLINHLSAFGVSDAAVDEAAALKLPGEQPPGDGQGVLAAQPDDADAALADGGGYGSDSILIHG